MFVVRGLRVPACMSGAYGLPALAHHVVYVVGVPAGAKMVRVDTGGVVANVHDHRSVRYRRHKHLI